VLGNFLMQFRINETNEPISRVMRTRDIPRMKPAEGIAPRVIEKGARYRFFNSACDVFGVNSRKLMAA
jgi:hypothetical protein